MDETDEFVDVYFPDDPHYVFGDLGGTFSTPCGDYEAAENTLSWNQIDESIALLDETPEAGLDYLITWICNQLNEGSCVGNMWIKGTEIVIAKQIGKDKTPRLSPISAYKQIGSSPGSGAMVSDAMEMSKKVGVLPLDTPENRAVYGDHVMPATGFYTKFPTGWKDTAAKFRGVELLTIRNTQQLFSALCQGFPVGVGREGHSIIYVRPMKDRRVKYCNSWGSWGGPGGTFGKGFGIDTARQVEKSASWAFAFRSVTVAV